MPKNNKKKKGAAAPFVRPAVCTGGEYEGKEGHALLTYNGRGARAGWNFFRIENTTKVVAVRTNQLMFGGGWAREARTAEAAGL